MIIFQSSGPELLLYRRPRPGCAMDEQHHLAEFSVLNEISSFAGAAS